MHATLYSVCCTNEAVLSEGLGGTSKVDSLSLYLRPVFFA